MKDSEIIQEFKECYLPAVIAQYGANDTIAINEEFSYFIDALCKAGTITTEQYETIEYNGE